LKSRKAVQVSRPVPETTPQNSLAQFQTILINRFPGQSIALQSSREGLVLSGTVADPEKALEIVSFVRGSFLVPVIDRLEVSRVSAARNVER
jgi:hypothetical protein